MKFINAVLDDIVVLYFVEQKYGGQYHDRYQGSGQIVLSGI